MRSLSFSISLSAALLFLASCEPAKTRALPDPGPNPATLSVTSEPPGAQISVDGVAVGKAPQEIAIKPGSHRVKAVMSGYFPLEQDLVLDAGGTQSVRLPLVASH